MRYQRKDLIERVIASTRNEEAIIALWECGSAAFNRSDEYSDIDIGLVVATGQIEKAAEVIRYALSYGISQPK